MTKKSCANCPAFVSASSTGVQQGIYGQAIGVDSCPTMGRILSSSSMSYSDNLNLLEEVGERCPSYGEHRPAGAQVNTTLRFGIGQPEEPEQVVPGGVTTCRACHFFVDARVVGREADVPMSLCAKLGRLIPETRHESIGRACTEGTLAHYPQGIGPKQHYEELLGNFIIEPQLAKYMKITDKVGAELTAKKASTYIDPRKYPTDKPVTDSEKAQGIRAWWKVTDGKHDIFLPIFDEMSFPEDQRRLIPQAGQDHHVEQYVDHGGLTYKIAALWMKLDETPHLVGIAGTGKTEMFRYMANRMQLPFHRVSITRSTELDELAGKVGFHNNETVFEYGIIPKAWRSKCVMVLDEPNLGPPDVTQFIRPLTDNSKALVLQMNNAEVIERNPYMFFGLATNPSWDSRNIGAEPMAAADTSRLMHMYVDFPEPRVEKEIIRNRCALDGYKIPSSTLNSIMAIAHDLRELGDSLSITWGIREQLKVARATALFSIQDAYRLAALDMMDPDEATQIRNVIMNHVSA